MNWSAALAATIALSLFGIAVFFTSQISVDWLRKLTNILMVGVAWYTLYEGYSK